MLRLLCAEGRAPVAKDAKAEFVKTEPFARRQLSYFGQLMPTFLPQVGRNAAFLAKAFALAPKSPADPVSLAPAAGVVPMHRQREVLLIQRIGYEPPIEDEFRNEGFYEASFLIRRLRYDRDMMNWFASQNVRNRMQFQGQ